LATKIPNGKGLAFRDWGILEFRDSEIGGFRDSGIQGFRNFGIRGSGDLRMWGLKKSITFN
jgi:hypothetical protein